MWDDGHAVVLAPKGLLPGRPADQSCPAQLSSIVFPHASIRLVGVWPGRPADLSGPATLILLLHIESIQATSLTSIVYNASSTITPVPSKFCTGPIDCEFKMSDGQAEKE